MLGLLVSVGAVSLLVWRGMNRSLRSSRDETGDRKKLAKLKTMRWWTLDEAEDGVVLARRYGDGAAERMFAKVVADLRKQRVKI